MAVFSTHQVRQFYVANDVKDSTSALNTAGDIFVGKGTDKLFIQQMNYTKELVGSDLIPVKNILKVSAVKAADMAHKIKFTKVGLDANINGGVPVAGQDYTLKLAFKQYIGLSMEDTYYVYGTVHATSGMTADAFVKKMAASLALNNKAQVNPIFHVYLKVGGKLVEVKDAKEITEASDNFLYISEAAQPWFLGTMEQGVIPFDIVTNAVTVDGDKTLWATKADYTPVTADALTDEQKVLPQGQKIADLEYFCMKERGDVYGNVSWPNAIPTKYMVDPDTEYDVITIHYAFQGDGMENQYSEKDIQIAAPAAVAADVITKLNAALTALGSDIEVAY